MLLRWSIKNVFYGVLLLSVLTNGRDVICKHWGLPTLSSHHTSGSRSLISRIVPAKLSQCRYAVDTMRRRSFATIAEFAADNFFRFREESNSAIRLQDIAQDNAKGGCWLKLNSLFAYKNKKAKNFGDTTSDGRVVWSESNKIRKVLTKMERQEQR